MVNAPVRLKYRPMKGIDNILLRIDCNKAEEGIRTTPGSQCALNALAIDEPLEYARLAINGEMQMWVDAEDSLDIW